MNKSDITRIQKRLAALGYDPGPIDGEMGPHTESAIIAFKRAVGLRPRAYIGPITWRALFHGASKTTAKPDSLPWVAEALAVLGRHEVRDNGWLRKWLASDGHALGDPAKLPWCGDFIETSIRLGLSNEPVPKNPYWALNWRSFGVASPPTYGCVASIERDDGGHVVFIMGADAGRYFCLGGNQANQVSIVPVDKHRFTPESFRWPATFPARAPRLPHMQSGAASNTREY